MNSYKRELKYWGGVYQQAQEQEEALFPHGTSFDWEGIVEYIVENWEVTKEELCGRTIIQYAEDIADAINNFTWGMRDADEEYEEEVIA